MGFSGKIIRSEKKSDTLILQNDYNNTDNITYYLCTTIDIIIIGFFIGYFSYLPCAALLFELLFQKNNHLNTKLYF